ncbi:glutathione S-transferase A4-like [Asterias rubens]|uniref:glutathione S-transferase A4-like n=1 Tax=Asterias rubens TaxID=7604 RepID=UPI0014557E54|nr:glutathione S-transferase A4-like [Asterias rubens]
MAAKAKLIYFDGRGRGEIIRFTLAAAGVEFEEVFLTEREQFLKLRDDGELLFNQVPALMIDGLKLVQVGAICRYIAQKHGLMGKSVEESAMVDMLFEAYKDFIGIGVLGVQFKKTEEEKQQDIEMIAKRSKERYVPMFEKIYEKSTSGFLVGDSLTLADLCWLEVFLWVVELVPELSSSFPRMTAFVSKISSQPRVSAFLKGPQRHSPPDQPYVATVRKVLQF